MRQFERRSIEEDKRLIEAGFEYVTDRDGPEIYRNGE